MMDATAVRQFIEARTIPALDPDTGETVAWVTYRADRSCHVRFTDGSEDVGRYGFEDHFYWTQYGSFRGGARNRFYLVDLGEGRAQAYHEDGRRAYIQIAGDLAE
ncbi:MAG: hypothetical protein AAGL24_00265 [Pseudomonadota bacterium]